MNNLNPYTLEDFRALINDLVDDYNDPDSEIHQLIVEGRHYVNEAARFDVEFAQKIGLVVSSIEDLMKYANNRKERS